MFLLYIHKLGQYLWVKILNFVIFGGFQESEYSKVCDFVWIFLGVTTKLDNFCGSCYM